MNDDQKLAMTAAREARQMLESDLLVVVERRVEQFKAQTGLCPHAIAIHLTEITTHGDPDRRYIVGSVSVSVEL